jgi:hypothetical protein
VGLERSASERRAGVCEVISLEFTIDSRDLEPWRNRKIERAIVRALGKAGNDAIKAMRIASTKKIRGRKRMKLGKLNRALPLAYPGDKREITALVWRMDVSGRPIAISEYPARQTAKGVSVQVNVGKRKLIKSAFITILKSGHRGVFRRRGPERLPIEEIFSTKVSDVFADGGFIHEVQTRATEIFASAYVRLLPLELDKVR